MYLLMTSTASSVAAEKSPMFLLLNETPEFAARAACIAIVSSPSGLRRPTVRADLKLMSLAAAGA